ncbi:hypothetical protein dsx2_2653 [Desulfovibrio sp. X2]|uniref:hypothetical protein n=1 Tax=Desulfovibrio sp. X2 TaxID=941449 RepID=UPI000358A196|nr:hypothetical protein [Desulfovibrio sp. X2]EPR42736.1 hypothetical protein dsx2_2653 [Desulfovibrio sp. X2]
MSTLWYSDFSVTDGTALENISPTFWVKGSAYQFITSSGQLVLQNYSAPYSVDLASQQVYVEFSITYAGGTNPQIIIGICNSGSATTTPDGPYVDLNTAGKIYLKRQYATLATISYAAWLSVSGTRIKVRLEQNASSQTIITVWDSTDALVASQTVTGVTLGGTYATIYGYGSTTTPPKEALDELGVYDYSAPPSSGLVVYLNVGGTWKTCTPYINVGGTWKTATPALNVGGTWKQ